MIESATRVTLEAPDISCGHCEATVTKAVGELSGVVTVKPSSVTKLVEIEFDPDQVTPGEIQEAMNRAGFPAVPADRNG